MADAGTVDEPGDEPGVGSGRPAEDVAAAKYLAAIATRLQGLCVQRGISVAAAESCTGGGLAQAITAIAGSSGYFVGSIVSYADAAKVELLGVGPDVIAAYGAVSAQVAVAMASGARERFGAIVAISITGISGPGGATPDKPIGLTYLGLATPQGTDVRRVHWDGDRAENRASSVRAALEWLAEWVEAQPA